MENRDQQVIDRVLGGEPAAFSDLVDRYQHRLLGFLWHQCGNRELAEDICQDAMIRSFQKLHLYSGEAQFFTWLTRIALNLLTSSRRKRRLESTKERIGFDVALDNAGEDHSPALNMEMSEMQSCVHRALSMLDEERRAVVLLRDFDGMDYEAIASTLDIPIGTVRSRLHRARLDLKQILEQKSEQLGLSEL